MGYSFLNYEPVVVLARTPLIVRDAPDSGAPARSTVGAIGGGYLQALNGVWLRLGDQVNAEELYIYDETKKNPYVRIHPDKSVEELVLGGSQTIQYKRGRKKVIWFPWVTPVDNMKLEHMEVQKKVYGLVWELYRNVGVLRAYVRFFL